MLCSHINSFNKWLSTLNSIKECQGKKLVSEMSGVYQVNSKSILSGHWVIVERGEMKYGGNGTNNLESLKVVKIDKLLLAS